MVPEHLPSPLMFGPDFPKIKIVMRQGQQFFESATNQNLFLGEQDFDDAGTYTMERFLASVGPCAECVCDPWSFAPDRHTCSLVWSVYVDPETERPEDWALRQPPDFLGCPSYSILRDMCQSEAQKRFLSGYCHALADELDPLGEWELSKFSEVEDHQRKLYFGNLQLALRRLALGYPALVPEVWLNYVGYEKTVEDEAHLSENPQRVDFVMFAEGRKCVIEIDGPSHYADFDQQSHTYTVSEKRYTRNLMIERSLRRQGWEIFRFSNYEVERADLADFRRLIADLPGTSRRQFASFNVIREALMTTKANEDIPF